MSVAIEILRDTALPRLREMARQLTPQRLAAAVGPAVSRLVARHLATLGVNKRGWPTTHFWARAARATNWQPVSDGALVSINQIGVRQRYHGGHIAPVKARALTIPVSPVAYGHVAADFPGAFVLKTAKGAYLAQRDGDAMGKEAKGAYRKRAAGMGGNARSRARARLNILFKLVKGVDQAPDPSVLPDWSLIAQTSREAVLAAIKPRGAAPSV